MYEALMKVSTGFKLVYYGLVLIVLAVVVALVGGFVLGAGAARGAGGAMAGFAGLTLLVGGMAATGSVVGLIGRFMCLAVPDQAGGAKSKIVLSVALEVVSLLISLANLADDLGGHFLPAEFKIVGSGGGLICSIVAAILFLLFARDLAFYIRRSKLADDAMSVLWLWVGAVGCYAAGLVVLLTGAGAGGPGGAGGLACAGGLLSLAGLVIALVALVRYARLLIEMAGAVRRYAGKRRYAGDFDDEDEGADFDDEDDRPRKRRRRRDEEEEEEEEDRWER